MPYKDRKQQKEYQCEYRKKNKQKKKEVNAKYYIENKEKIKKQDSLYRENNRGEILRKQQKRRSDYPWINCYNNAKARCTYPNSINFHRYGGRGIKFLLTRKEIKELWFRDRAYKLKVPSIDRKDNDGNYEFSNCRFIEKDENSKKGTKNCEI